jgi:hypothetical protein
MFVGDKARVGAEGELMAEGNQQQQQQDPAQRSSLELCPTDWTVSHTSVYVASVPGRVTPR